jgi:hypothetical protein
MHTQQQKNYWMKCSLWGPCRYQILGMQWEESRWLFLLFLCLFNDSVSNRDYTSTNDWMIVNNGQERTWNEVLEVTYPGIFLERRRKTIKNGSQDSWEPSWKLNRVQPEHKSEALPHVPTCPVKWMHKCIYSETSINRSRIRRSISMVPEGILFQLWLLHLLFSWIHCSFFRPPTKTMNRGFSVHWQVKRLLLWLDFNHH